MGYGDEGVYCVVCIVWSGLVRCCAVPRAETSGQGQEGRLQRELGLQR